MATLAAVDESGTRRPSARRLTAVLPLVLGYMAILVPTVIVLGRQSWNQESGAHGPIVLAAGAWLLWRGLGAARDLVRPGALWLSLTLLAASLAVYIFGRVFGFLSFEGAGLYGAGVALLYSVIGEAALRQNWFPVAYLAFLVPPPGSLLDKVTGPLKQFVSSAAIGVLSMFGLPVSRQGVTIDVAQYRLLVEDACSGLNSIIGLSAVSLLYIYLLRGTTWRYAAFLAACTVPIAVLGNIVRIMTLILLTYFFGDAVAQGFLHFTAGLFLFAIDLLLVFALDSFFWRVAPKSWRLA
jgi:exosortase